MLKLQKYRNIGQQLAKTSVRTFAAAPLHEGLQNQFAAEPIAAFDIDSVSEVISESKTPKRKATGPVMPHFDYSPAKYSGPSYEQIKAQRKEFVSPASFHYYKEPLLIVDGKMQYLWDHTGKRYLDYIAGVSTVGIGHCHPRITSAMKEQMDKLQHITTIYMNDQHSQFAAELAEKLPEGVDSIYFTSSGSEANALATQFARLHTGNYPIMTLKNGYHGHAGSQHLTALGPWNHNLPRTQGVVHACFPDVYRGPFSKKDAPKMYADQVKDAIDFDTSGNIALFMVEAVQGAGGIIPMPQGFMQHAIPHVKKAGGLLLSDEVQTAFGRMGTHYWGCEMLDYQPDIVTMAKHIGNGFPLAAVAVRNEIAEAWKDKITFSTYGSNPIAMAAGREVMKVVDEEKLQEKALQLGILFRKGLNELKDKYECVGDARGHGIMWGLEIVKDKDSKDPDPVLFANIYERTREYGVLFGKGGRFGNVFRIQPPMAITPSDIEFSLDVLDRSIKEALENL